MYTNIFYPDKVYIPCLDMRKNPPERIYWITSKESAIYKLWLEHGEEIKILDIKNEV